jgi:hypothetical protein
MSEDILPSRVCLILAIEIGIHAFCVRTCVCSDGATPSFASLSVSGTLSEALLDCWVFSPAASRVRSRRATQTLSPRELLQSVSTRRPCGLRVGGFQEIGNRSDCICSRSALEQMPQHVVEPFLWLILQSPSRKVRGFSSCCNAGLVRRIKLSCNAHLCTPMICFCL